MSRQEVRTLRVITEDIQNSAGGTPTIAGMSVSELERLDGVTAGTVTASKAVVVDSNKDIGDFRNLDAVNIDAGASGVAGTVDVFPTTAARGKLIIAAVANDGATNVTISNAAMGQASVVSIPDPGAATANFLLTSQANDQSLVTATAAEINYLDITTLGTGAASKAVVLDAGDDYTWPNTGVLTLGVLATAAEAAEHGAGAIGTAAAPVTYRWIEHGVIVTQTKVDLTGLASVATANDVIGLSAGGAAYIGRNVEATNGVIFKVEFSCIETPAGGDNDVNVVANANAALAYDGAGGTTYLSNSGDLLKGQTIQNLVPALTEGDYFYLTAGTGDTAAAYTAGMYILTTYGHAALA